MDSMPTGQKMEVNGVELYYVQKGNGPNVILCVPGAVSPCEWTFASQLEHFGKENGDYTVVTFEQRGYGFSRPCDRQFTFKDGDHHLKTDAIDAYALMEKLGHSQFSVLGWCDGGVTAIFLAALYPSAVTHLVVWGSRTYITDIDVKSSVDVQDEVDLHPKFAEFVAALYDSLQNFSDFYQRFLASLKAHAASENNDVCTKEMLSMECPTLVLHGEKDDFTPLSHAEHVKKSIKGSELQVIEGGKHTLQVGETGKELNKRVEQFLRSPTVKL